MKPIRSYFKGGVVSGGISATKSRSPPLFFRTRPLPRTSLNPVLAPSNRPPWRRSWWWTPKRSFERKTLARILHGSLLIKTLFIFFFLSSLYLEAASDTYGAIFYGPRQSYCSLKGHFLSAWIIATILEHKGRLTQLANVNRTAIRVKLKCPF